MNPFRSWLGTLNFVLLQWFCVRLELAICIETGDVVDWRVLGPVLPLTGWWTDYIWLWGGP